MRTQEEVMSTEASGKKMEPMQLDKTGSLVVNDTEDLMRVVNLWIGSKMLPEPFVPNPAKQVSQELAKQRIMTALQLLDGLGFGLKQAFPLLKNIAFVRGAIFVFGDLPLMVVERSGLLEDKDEWFFDEDGKRICSNNGNLKAKVYGVKVRLKPVGRTWKEYEFTLDDAKQARLMGGEGAWSKHTKRMLLMRARGFALRDNFAAAFASARAVSILESDTKEFIPSDYDSTQIIDAKEINDNAQDLSDVY